MFKARCLGCRVLRCALQLEHIHKYLPAGGRWENEEDGFIKPIASSFAVLGSRSTGQGSAGRSQQTHNLAFSSRCR